MLSTSLVAATTAANAETIRDALAAAYKYNPRLDSARSVLRATDEEVARAHAGFRPTLGASADVTHQSVSNRPSTASDGTTTSTGYAVNLTQPIFSGFRTVNAVRVAEATVRAGRETLRTTEQAVLLEAATAFMDVVRDQAIVKLRENNVVVLSTELKATRDRFAVGEVTRTDVAQAESRRAASVSALDLARSNLKASRASFERVIGHPASRLVEPNARQLRLPRSQPEAIGVALKESPTVVAALYREQAARYTVDQIWGELLPQVQIDASYSHRDHPSPPIDENEVGTITGRINVPLYQGGEVQARVRQAKQTHIARLQEIEQARTEAQATVVTAWAQLVASRAQIESDQAQVNAARIALNGVREEQKVGQRTILDVLNAEQELLNGEVQLATTRRNVVVASFNVLSAIGRLTGYEQALAKVAYDPEVHYFEVRRKWWGVNITHSDGRREHYDFWKSHGEHQPLK